MAMLANAPSRLNIPCHVGTPQAVHPCVIDFQTEHGVTWGGYRYWMAFTPYPGGDDAHEDPNIVASHDGQTWVVPTGFTNPIDDQPGHALNVETQQYDGAFNADTSMVYDPDNDRLCVYWITQMRGGDTGWGMQHVTLTRLAYVYSDGSVTLVGGEYGYLFHAPKTPYPNTNVEPTFPMGSYRDSLSPAVWRESATRWHMWSVGFYQDVDSMVGILYRFSEDGVTWGDPQPCTPQDPIRDHFPGYSVWHIQCKHNPLQRRVEFIGSGQYDGVHRAAFYFECSDSDPTSLDVPEPFRDDPLLEVKVGGWDAGRIYTTAFTITPSVEQNEYEIWYSARGTLGWGIGYISATLPTSAGYPYDLDVRLTAPLYPYDLDVRLTAPLYPYDLDVRLTAPPETYRPRRQRMAALGGF